MENPEVVVVCLNFLKMWKDKRWKKLLKYSQITWVECGHPTITAIEWFESWFLGRIPYKWSVIGTKSVGETTVEVIMRVTVDDFKSNRKITKRMLMNVICEEDTYTPSLKGKWGVNPVSCLRLDNV